MKYLVLISVLILFSCSPAKKVASENQKVSEQKKLLGKESVVLSFERTLCYGMCPAYKITVRNDGSALYEGYKFTEKIGNYQAVLSPEQFEAILNEAGQVGFFDMQNEYDNPAVTDLPSVMTMIEGPNGPKNVLDRMNAPAELKRLEKYLDGILLGLDWKPGGNQPSED